MLVLVACLLAGTSWWWADRQGWWSSLAAPQQIESTDSPAQTPSATVPDRVAGLESLLAARGAALLARDREGWMATVDPGLPDLVAAQAQLFDNLGAVPLSVARFEYAGDGPALSAPQQTTLGPQAYVAKVIYSYRIADADGADVRHEQFLTVVPDAGGWLVAGTSDGPPDGYPRDRWELGPVFVARGARCLVIGTDETGLDEMAAQIDTAAAQVDTVWGDQWPRTVVVLVPATQTEMAQLLGRADETGLDQIAAVTTGEVGLPMGAGADRVIVNPAGFAQLDGEGPAIVLTHEVTHVATRASGSATVPTWFSEGFSDYVAYRGRGLTDYQVAGDVLSEVAAGRGPSHLPTDTDFDATMGSVAPAYSSSYLAIDYIADTWSEAAVLELYRAQLGSAGPGGSASTPVPLDQAMPLVIGVDLPTFEQQWLAHIAQVAGS